MASSITAQYEARVAAQLIERDAAQLDVVERLARLEARILEHRLARKSSSLGWLFGKRASALPPIKGLYIFGEVGRGKTMLMDLFFEASPVVRKRRAHFHEFMLDVHERVHALPARDEARRARRRGSDPARRRRDSPRRLAALLRRVPRHRHRRRDDPRPPVRAAVRARRRGGRDLQRARRTISTRTGSTARCSCRSSRMLEQHMDVVRLDARTDFRLEKLAGSRSGTCRPTPTPTPRSMRPGGG